MAKVDDDLIGDLPAADPDGCTERERRFVEYYAACSNPKKAALAAGYPAEMAESQATAMLWRPHVKKAIEIRSAERERRLAVTTENIAREYARIGFFDPRKLFTEDGLPIPIHELDDATAACIAGLDVQTTEVNGAITTKVLKYKLADKTKGLDAMARMLGMFIEKVELTGQGGGPVQLENVTDNERARRVAFMLMKALETQKNRTIDITPSKA